jgi:hypothetical protein
MTAGILLRMIIRRWYVFATCLAIAVWIGMSLGQTGRTYWTQAQVVFVEPGGGSVTNINDGVAPSLINFAGTVQRKLTGDGAAADLPSSTATLYGSGIRRGYSITLPNTGNQWAASFSKPMLAIQVTGSSSDEVRTTLEDVLERVQQITLELQSDAGALPETFIEISVPPSPPDILDVGSTPLGKAKGLVVVGGIGITLSGCVTYAVDRWFARWPVRQQAVRRSQA